MTDADWSDWSQYMEQDPSAAFVHYQNVNPDNGFDTRRTAAEKTRVGTIPTRRNLT